MINISNKNLKDFQNHGWIKIPMGISKQKIDIYKIASKKLIKKAKIINFPYRRIYFDFLFDFNLAAIEIPLHESICNDEIYDFFKNLNLEESVNKITGFENSICTLIRLFCMNNYNYSGNWHSDNEISDKSLQVAIYLKDEKGFKIIKKEKKNELKKRYGKKIDYQRHLPLLLPRKFYNTIDAKAGDILFFEPSLLHQGSSSNSRMQFHMRFENKNIFSENEIDLSNKFKINFATTKNYNTSIDFESIGENFPKDIRSTKIRKFLNLLNYFFPIINMFRYLKSTNLEKKLKLDLMANTFFQSK